MSAPLNASVRYPLSGISAAMYFSVFSMSGAMKPLDPSGKPPVSIPSRCTSSGIIAEDTRALQDWLGHQSIQHTVRYTELAPTRFKDFYARRKTSIGHLVDHVAVSPMRRARTAHRARRGSIADATQPSHMASGGAGQKRGPGLDPGPDR